MANKKTQELKLDFVELHEAGPAVPPTWLWEGYVAKGRVTLLSGFAKTGKSTLLSHVLRQMEHGGELITDIAPAKVLVVSEEHLDEWRERRDRLGLGPHITYLSSRFGFKLDYENWLQLTKQIAIHCLAHGIELVIYDTFVGVSPAKNENDSSEIHAALAPLHVLKQTGDGVAVLLIHHTGKGQGLRGQKGRGSSTFQGDVDINLEWTFYKHDQDWTDRRRVLAGNGRVASDIVAEMVLELDEDKNGYTIVGSGAELSRSGIMEAVEGILIAGRGKSSTKGKIASQLAHKPSARKLDGLLELGVEEGRWILSGEGRRGSPFMYHIEII